MDEQFVTLMNKYMDIEITLGKVKKEMRDLYDQTKIHNVDENKVMKIYDNLNYEINKALKNFIIENLKMIKETMEEKINKLEENEDNKF